MIQRICKLLKMKPPYYANKGLLFASDITANLPIDGTAGYQTGCLFQVTDGGDSTSLYVNEGSVTACDFDAIAPTASEIAFTETINLGSVDYHQVLSTVIANAQSTTGEQDLQCIRASLTVSGANTNKQITAISSSVYANAVGEALYCYQGGLHVAANPSQTAYGISQSLSLDVASISEARCVYASIKGTGTATVSTVFMAVASATAQTLTANYEANVAAFCASASALKLTGEGLISAAISIQMGSGTGCPLFLTAGSETAYKDGAKTAAINTGNAYPKADGVLKIHLNATDYYIPYLALANATGA